MLDGVRAQIAYRREQYEEYKRRVRELYAAGRLGNPNDVMLLEFSDHAHQAIMTRKALTCVTTPLILFIEHDAILRQDPPIVWQAIFGLLLSGEANLVRFYNWADVWWEHEPLMRGEFFYAGSRFVKTVQYSQWPLVSRTDYHQRILSTYFGEAQRTMIEPVMHGPVAAAPWEDNKIVIYFDGKLTFSHRDGRADATGRRDPSDW
jgi:hypothetical protein